MKQKALMILDLLCMVAQGVWADDEPAPNKAEKSPSTPITPTAVGSSSRYRRSNALDIGL